MNFYRELLNNRYILRANMKLKDRAKEMSREMTRAEQLLWFNILASRKLCGYKFVKQKIIEHYIIDFYCSELLLAIEADGLSHEKCGEYDRERDDFIAKLGIETIRVYNTDIYDNLDGVYEYLKGKIAERCKYIHNKNEAL